MSGPTPPPSSKDSSVKREFSVPPDLLQEFEADVLSSDVLDDPLRKALREEVLAQTAANPSEADVERQDAPSCHEQSAEKESPASMPGKWSSKANEAATPQQKYQTFPDDVSEFSECEDNVSDAESDGLFVPDSAVKSNSPSKSPRQQKPHGRLARTAKEWHKKQQDRLRAKKPNRIRVSALKLQQIDNLPKKLQKGGIQKRKSAKQSKRKSQARLDLSIFLQGGADSHWASHSGIPDSDPVPKEATGSNRKNFWNNFKELNHGIDLHKCSVDWNDLLKAARSFGLNQMQIEEKK
jgi:hypothetical protein